MPENITTTGIDGLVEYLNTHGQTDVPAIAGALGIDQKVIEQWANILESAGALKISYKVDRMYLSPAAGSTKEQLEAAKKIAQVNASTFEADVKARQAELAELGKKIESLDRMVKGSASVFEQKSRGSKKALDDLASMEKQISSIFNSIKGKAEYISGTAAKIDVQIAAMKTSVEASHGTASWSEDINRIIGDMNNRLKLISETNSSMRRKFDSEMDRQKKEAHDLFTAVASELDAVGELVMQKQRDSEKAERESAVRQKDINKLVKEAEKHREEVINSIASTKQSLDSLYSDSEMRRKGILQEIEMYKKQFGELADIDSRIKAVNADIEAAKKSRDEIKKDLQMVLAMLKDGRKTKAVPKEKRAEAAKAGIDSAAAKMEKLHKNVDSVKTSIDGVLK